jgi:hypothetical protein
MHSLLELVDAAYKGILSKAAAGYFSFSHLSGFVGICHILGRKAW